MRKVTVSEIEALLPTEHWLGVGANRFIAERIVRSIECPEPFKPSDAPMVMIQARFKCPCAAGDVLTQGMALPFDIDERSFQYCMKQWWTQLQREVRAHMLAPKVAGQ